MARVGPNPILQLIQRTAGDPRARCLSDHELLRCFDGHRDEAAFHALLLRHGPMVLDVCRGVLACEADAEDAFQATFLVLASRAGTIRKGASVGSWLHGVAYRTSLKARSQRTTRQKHEAGAPAPPVTEPDDLTWREVRQVLHEEVARLAERYRGPLVACYLEGRTQEEAAAQLGLGKTALKERLERARSLLRARLVRRGLGPAALIAAAWPSPASAHLSVTLVSSTVKSASACAAGQWVPPDRVAALMEGATTAMLPAKFRLAVVLLLVVGAFTSAGALARSHMGGAPGAAATAQERPMWPNPETLSGPTEPVEAHAGAPAPQPKAEDGDPNAKWPTEPPRILEHDPYLLVPHSDGTALDVGCVAREIKLTDKQIGELWKRDREWRELTADMGHEEQKREYTKAMHKKLPQILTPSQIKRFQQVGLRILGVKGGYPSVGALGYPETQQILKLSDQQKKNMRALNKDARKEWDAEVQVMGGIDVPRALTLSTKIHKATLEKALTLLDRDQQRVWDGLVGESFTFTLDRFRLDDLGEYKKTEW